MDYIGAAHCEINDSLCVLSLSNSASTFNFMVYMASSKNNESK